LGKPMEPDEKDKRKAARQKLITDLEQHKPVVVKIRMRKSRIFKNLDAPKPAAAPRKLFRSLDQPATKPAPAQKPAKRKRKIFENL
jgi:hypothetical protein